MRKVPSWDQYFMKIAQAVALRSKDPSSQVGSLIVDETKHVVGMGYNGMPPGFVETAELWERPTKYEFVIHSEINALANSHKSPRGCSLFTTMFPCAECSKSIAASGIKRVVYLDGKYENSTAREIFKQTGTELIQLIEEN